MQKITPFLWFNNNAQAAVDFYVSVFKNANITQASRYGKNMPMPEGSIMTLSCKLAGQDFVAMNGGPGSPSFSPAVSFFVGCDNAEEVNELWDTLSEGGKVLMPLDKYPFNDHYGFCEDKFGVSWQIFLGAKKQKITPALLFVGKQYANAEPAIHMYTALFNGSINEISNYEDGGVQFASFTLASAEFNAMSGQGEHKFSFTPAISFFVLCNDQAEIDKYWDVLVDGGKEMQCGWVSDKYGVTWQILPEFLFNTIHDPDKEKVARVMAAMMKMVKLDVAALEAAAK